MGISVIIYQMPYSELKKYNSIEKILPKTPDYAFLLYQSSPSNGHWIVITRDRNNNINYFDSYGNDHPLRWTGLDTRKKLGEEAPMLSMLMNKTQLSVYYNNVDYQGDGSDINTCAYLGELLSRGAVHVRLRGGGGGRSVLR